MRITNTTLKKILLGLCVVVIVGCSSTSPSGGEQDTDTTPSGGEPGAGQTPTPGGGAQDADTTPTPGGGAQGADQTPITDNDEQDTDTTTFTGTYEEHNLGGHTLIVEVSGDDQTKRLEIADGTTTIELGSFGTTNWGMLPLIMIQELVIPNSVTSISLYAFANNALKTLTIPNSVTSIGIGAFRDNDLTTLELPTSESFTTISEDAFEDNALKTLAIPDSVTSIGAGAFRGNELTTLTIPISVTSIGRDAFRANPNLKNVTIPRGAYNRLGAEVLRQAFPSNSTFWDENGNAY